MATRMRLYPNQAETPLSQPCDVGIVNERPVLLFDGANNERCYWTFVLPEGWRTSPQVAHAYVRFSMASAISGTVDVDLYIESIGDGDLVNLHTETSFDNVNSLDGTTVSSTAGYMDALDVSLTNHDSSGAGDLARLWFERDAANDTALGDMVVYAIELRDNT